MPTRSIKESIDRAIEYLTTFPSKARYTDSYATASLVSGLRFKMTDSDGRTLTSDMPKGVGGEGVEPSPGWLFRASMASCIGSLVVMRAAQLGITLSKLEITVDSQSDDRGILGMDESVPAGPLSMRIAAKMEAAGGSESAYRELVEYAMEHCPVCDATSGIEKTLELNA
jgi:uncharacterized OsmC-like protein